MKHCTQSLTLIIMLSVLSNELHAQHTITTQPVAQTSICPGSTLDVSFVASGTYPASNTFVVQLSNGGEYMDMPTGTASYNSSSGRYTVSATIPGNTAAGTTYQLRVTASNPAVVGSPGSTALVVKVKPGVPIVRNMTICQQFCTSPSTCEYSLFGTPAAGASISWYSPSGSKYSPFLTSTPSSIGIYSGGGTAWTFGENTLYASQTLNGCESEKTPFIVTFNPNQPVGPSNYNGESYAVCQNSGMLTLDKFVYPPPAGYQILYFDPLNTSIPGTTVPPTIRTDVVKVYHYTAAYLSDKGCRSPARNDGDIYAKIKPSPGKPTLLTNSLSYCQNQTANLLSASTTDAAASLVWYGTDATGGTGTSVIPRPATDVPSTFRYYVAQQLNNCEGERSEIVVTVKGLSTATLTASSTTIYEGDAVKLSVAFTGDGPWRFTYRDSSSVGNTTQEVLTNVNPHALELTPLKSTNYRITALSNGCGASLSLPAPVQITVNPLLAVEALPTLIRVFPVPTTSSITVQVDASLMVGLTTLTLIDSKGNSVQKLETRQLSTQLSLADQAAGLYILQIRTGEYNVYRRLVKQ
ncbi:T9SS type A sorting domain-containing protein [Fibrella aquatica]|uniref:T9SS type A sorting domain-containing protein n=1 Tax=Fibrella aquatica TaxID=3242487 RepID=UPI003520820E